MHKRDVIKIIKKNKHMFITEEDYFKLLWEIKEYGE